MVKRVFAAVAVVCVTGWNGTSSGPSKGERVFYGSIAKGKPGSSKWEGSKRPTAPRSLAGGRR